VSGVLYSFIIGHLFASFPLEPNESANEVDFERPVSFRRFTRGFSIGGFWVRRD
jgi:hypothetical protein